MSLNQTLARWGIEPSIDHDRCVMLENRDKTQYMEAWFHAEVYPRRWSGGVDILVAKGAERHVLRWTRHGAMAILWCPRGPIEGQDLMYAMGNGDPCPLCMGVLGALRRRGPRSWNFNRGSIPFMPFMHQPWRRLGKRGTGLDYRRTELEEVALESKWTPPSPFMGRRAAMALHQLRRLMHRACGDAVVSPRIDIGDTTWLDVTMDARPFKRTAYRMYGTVDALPLIKAHVACGLAAEGDTGRIPVIACEVKGDTMYFTGFKFDRARSCLHRGIASRDANGAWQFKRWIRGGSIGGKW